MPPPPGGPGPNVQVVQAPMPPAAFMFFMPIDEWGLTFDLSTRIMQDPPPNGWGVNRSTIYSRIARRLQRQGFYHAQYSVYNCQNISGLAVYHYMCNLRVIEPAGIFSTAVSRLQMFHIDHHTMIATNEVRLGGNMATHLTGTTPANLVPNHVPSAPHPLDPSWCW
ncbi:uncharacterized protein C8Q71DRAFT_749171 [Rhodofomes roseus]|uniref:Uncharacterized protein n=1 Tax=Rhodofomes roseus TaxID=34475 RepID=A0ABQ8KM23_9APHY|nr:uncharacterized protein C8Q71DRAFT_749171 [Rhodofomes roseus]KAH9839374.1 hypothetical protein C8Q71DRAFT_749171 [Rhodofomes roseus]